MLRVRQIGLVVLAVAAILVFFAMKPEEAFQPGVLPSTGAEASDYTDAIDEALATYELNDANADTAPKQQVVNGWVARDLLTVMAFENVQALNGLELLSLQNEIAYEAATAPEQHDERPALLLVIVVFAIALWGATAVPPKLEFPPSPISSPNEEAETP